MGNKEKNFVSAVIYVHNAENRIENFLRTIIGLMEENFEHSEIICVNDSSTDNSLNIIKNMKMDLASTTISIINMSYFHGPEAAMNAGVDLSIGDFVFEFDNTVQDFAQEEVMKVYWRSLQGYDIVNAAPDRKEKFTSRLFYRVFERFTNSRYRMHTESFRILSRRVINRISAMNKTIPYRKAVYAAQGLKTDTLIYKVADGIRPSCDKQESGYRSGLAIDALILFTGIGYSFAKAMTVLMMCMSVFMIVYSIVIYATAHPVEGWTTTILFLSVAFFGLFGILTVIIKYLQLLVDLVFKKQHYSFESIEKIT